MFDNFFKNLHYFKLINGILFFNNRQYRFDNLDEKFLNSSIIDLYNNEETKSILIEKMYEVYTELEIIWGKSQGYDGSKKYIDRVAYVEYFDERLNELRRSTIKNYRFYSEEEEEKFKEFMSEAKNLYILIYA